MLTIVGGFSQLECQGEAPPCEPSPHEGMEWFQVASLLIDSIGACSKTMFKQPILNYKATINHL